MRVLATSLLVLAAVVYALTLHHSGVLGYVNAAAEASMVGALADWFAVTALFKRPLGLPIPHTALIQRKKDQLAEALREFVLTNFLHEQAIRDRLEAAQVARRVGEWVATSPTVDRLVDDVLGGLQRWLTAHPHALTETLDARLPPWLPGIVRDLVSDRLHDELLSFVTQVRDDPGHPLRRELRAYGARLEDDLAQQRRIDGVVADAVVTVVQRYGDDITTVITHTIQQWDGRETSRRLELYVGRDLQFIRINGTVVGALAGLLIHAITVLA